MSLSPQRKPKRPHTSGVSAVALACAFCVAAAAKVNSVGQLAALISAAALAPPWLASYVAVAVIAAEFAIGLGLAVPPTRLPALWAAAAMALAYAGFSIWRMVADVDAPCNCFGPLLRSTPLISLSLALSMFAIAVAGILSVKDHHRRQEACVGVSPH